MQRSAYFLIPTLLFTGCSASAPTPAPQLTAEHRQAIMSALQAKSIQPPASLEISESGWLVATFQLDGSVTSGPLKALAEEALLTIRNTMYPTNIVSSYRVTLNGPSPGPGLLRRYGSARFIEGAQLEWQAGK